MDQRVPRVGKNNRAQGVTIPLEYRFPEGMKEVFIRKIGEEVILSPRPNDWNAFLASNVRASPLARQHFRHHALRADFRRVRLVP